jgi:hypothetical protein
MDTPSSDVIYHLHIRLAYIEPPIWQRMLVPSQVTPFSLLQVVMGWENYHLHINIGLKRSEIAGILSTRKKATCFPGYTSSRVAKSTSPGHTL